MDIQGAPPEKTVSVLRAKNDGVPDSHAFLMCQAHNEKADKIITVNYC